MSRRLKIMIAAGLVTAVLGGGAAFALQADGTASLRASGQAGENVDGYMGVVGDASQAVRDQVQAINIKRRALYTRMAQDRGVTIEEAATATGCQLIKRLGAGQFYNGGTGWTRLATGSRPQLPAFCG